MKRLIFKVFLVLSCFGLSFGIREFHWGTKMMKSTLLKRQKFVQTTQLYRRLMNDFQYSIEHDLRRNLTMISHIDAVNFLDNNATAELLGGGPLHTFAYIHIENEIDRAYKFVVSVYGW